MTSEPNPKTLAKVVAACVIDDTANVDKIGFPIARYKYTLDFVPIEKDLDIPEDLKEWAIENQEEFEELVSDAITNHLNYIVLEGFGYTKNDMVKFYTTKQLNDQLDKILN
jgi:hypothetical protein